jgi:omega-amidase
MDELIVGYYQMDVLPADPDGNRGKLERVIQTTEQAGCRLLVLPEMWSCGFAYSALDLMAEQTPMMLDRLQELALRSRMILVGSLPELEAGNIYNTCYVIGEQGTLLGQYRKIHLFSLTGEPEHFERGTAPTVCDTTVGRLGLAICYDLRFPELSRRLALDGTDILCFSALWPVARIRHWSLLLRARAVENQLFVVGCNGSGMEGNTTYGGASAIISPTGSVLAEAGDGERWGIACLNFEEMRDFRSRIPCFADRTPGIYGEF